MQFYFYRNQINPWNFMWYLLFAEQCFQSNTVEPIAIADHGLQVTVEKPTNPREPSISSWREEDDWTTVQQTQYVLNHWLAKVCEYYLIQNKENFNILYFSGHATTAADENATTAATATNAIWNACSFWSSDDDSRWTAAASPATTTASTTNGRDHGPRPNSTGKYIVF